MSRDLMAELRQRLRGGSPGVDRLRADLAERTRIEQEAAEQAADDQAPAGSGPAGRDPLRRVLTRKLESRAVRVRPDGTVERPQQFQSGDPE